MPNCEIISNTPIEKYQIDGGEIFVKREDLCSIPPLPPFAKVRGLYAHLVKLKSLGISVVGYTETSISMAGVGVSVIAKELGVRAVIFNPVYKEEQEVLTFHRSKWKEFGADIIDIKAGMAKVNYHISRKLLLEEYGNCAIMLPLGIPFSETVDEVAKEFIISKCDRFKTIVICVGSGTMAAGVLKGIRLANANVDVFGVLCRMTKRLSTKRSLILAHAGIVIGGDFFYLIDFGYEYTQKVDIDCPFPSNNFYDKKAYKFLAENRKVGYNKNKFKEPILFWNIGA